MNRWQIISLGLIISLQGAAIAACLQSDSAPAPAAVATPNTVVQPAVVSTPNTVVPPPVVSTPNTVLQPGAVLTPNTVVQPAVVPNCGAVAGSAVVPSTSRITTVVAPVEAVVDRDDVYSPINDHVIPRVEPLPAVVRPVDTLKQQIYNRIDAGLISGQLTQFEAGEVRAMMDDVAHQEAVFKLEAGGLTASAAANLMRKYQMVDLALSDRLNNTAYDEYMPNFQLRRSGVENNIHYDLAAGNLTPEEGEQLLAALNNVSEEYATASATGNVVSANELEALHRDLSMIQAKIAERVGGKIAFVAPATHDKLAQFRQHIDEAIACKALTVDQASALIKIYNQYAVVEQATVADEGVHAADLQMIAKQIDNLDFILTRQLQDRSRYGAEAPRAAGSSNKL